MNEIIKKGLSAQQRILELQQRSDAGVIFSNAELWLEYERGGFKHARTVTRDIKALKEVGYEKVPVEGPERRFRMKRIFDSNVEVEPIRRFAVKSDFARLYPSFEANFIGRLLNGEYDQLVRVYGPAWGELSEDQKVEFHKVLRAASQNIPVTFQYRKLNKEISLRERVHPYQLIQQGGIWYLGAVEKGAFRLFAQDRISMLRTLDDERFTPDPSVYERIASNNTAWYGDHKQRVSLKVSKEVRHYFERQKLIPGLLSQNRNKEFGLNVECEIEHRNALFPVLRYWYPNIKIAAPEELRQRFVEEIRAGLDHI